MIKRQYADLRQGQLHYRTLAASVTPSHTPLVCLHPMPYTGAYFDTLLPLLNTGRDVHAPDYPGFGGSDKLTSTPAIEDYAEAIIEFIGAASIDTPVSLLGFHTGCLVIAEIALRRPDLLSKTIYIDIPLFTPEKARAMLDAMPDHLQLSSDLNCLRDHWEFDVGKRLDGVPLQRAFEIFVEHIRASSQPADGFRAAFRYPAMERFAGVNTEGLVIASQSGLLEPTREAAKLLPNVQLMELTEIKRHVLEEGAAEIANVVNDYLQAKS